VTGVRRWLATLIATLAELAWPTRLTPAPVPPVGAQVAGDPRAGAARGPAAVPVPALTDPGGRDRHPNPPTRPDIVIPAQRRPERPQWKRVRPYVLLSGPITRGRLEGWIQARNYARDMGWAA